MRIKKYFVRSYSKLYSSSTSFSSWSSSSSLSSASATARNRDDTNRDDNCRTNRRKRSTWLKRFSSRSSRKKDGSNTRNKTQNKTRNNKSKPKSDKNYCNGNNSDDPETQKNVPPPPLPLLRSSSPELQKAISHFKINTLDDFTRENIKRKYKRLSLIHHPDRNGNDEKSVQEMQKINEELIEII